jgi:hypothetical protein
MRSQPKSLDAQLAALSRDIAPPRHLWRNIVNRIARQQRFVPPFALAAAAACVILAGALSWVLWQDRNSHVGEPASRVARASNFDEPSDPGYRAARARLETTFQERLAMLSPDTRAQIEASLAVIRQAHENIRQALASEPANPVLERLFESTWHDEFDLYDRVVRTTAANLTRT